MKTLVLITTLLVSSAGAHASTYSCQDNEGRVIKMEKTDDRARFMFQTDDGQVYTCNEVTKRSQATSTSHCRKEWVPGTWTYSGWWPAHLAGCADPIAHHYTLPE